MTNIFSVNNFRAAGFVFKEYLAKEMGSSPDQIAISPYVVRVTKPLSATESSYDFTFTNSQTKNASELLLADSDIIQIYGISLGIQKFAAAATDFSTIQYNWPDPAVFTAGTGAEAKSLELIYGGLFNLWTGNTLRIPNLHNSVFRTAPSGGGIYGPTAEERGYFIPNEYPVMYGNKQNRVNVSVAIGDKTAMPQSGATANNLVLQFLCFRYNGQNSDVTGCSL